MAKAPAFQWYPKDCDTDERVRSMTDEEFGFYMRCLNHAWLNDGLPECLGDIARILPRHPRKLARLWQAVSKCFELNGGRYRNLKQEEQRSKNEALSESRRLAAGSRWSMERSMQLHDSLNASASVLHMQRKETADVVLFCSPTEETSKQEERGATWISGQHDRWYEEAFWNKKNRTGSLRAYERALNRLCRLKHYSRAQAADFLFQAAIDDRARFESTQDWEWRHRLHPATWLNNERWEDQPTIAIIPKRAQSIRTEDWPETTALVRGRFWSADDDFMANLVQDSIQAAVSSGLQAEEVTDSRLAGLVETSLKTDNVKFAGLLLKTVPQIIKTLAERHAKVIR